MAKIFTYVIIVTGLMILFNLAGLTTLTGKFINFTVDTFSNIQTSVLWIAIAAAISGLAAVGAIIIGTLTRGGVSSTTIGASLLSAPLLVLIGDLISIVTDVPAGWVKYLLFLVIAPIVFGYLIALFDWVRGTD